MLEPANYAKIHEMYKEDNKSIVTDLSPEQIKNLACAATEFPEGSAKTYTIGKDQVHTEGQSMIINDLAAVQNEVWEIFPKE